MALTACGSSGDDSSTNDSGAGDVVTQQDATAKDSGATDGGAGDAVVDTGPNPCLGDTLDANRDRLLQTYYAYLKANATTPQSNGLSNTVTSPMDVWQKLDPSSQAVFLTLSARMFGSKLRVDGSSMLSHITKIYRITGGQGATAIDPGTCGGGEYNRMIMSMDTELHTAQLAANADQGASPYDIADVIPTSYWRDSHDLGGPHAPFDLSDETNSGAPRGQTQYFKDWTSTVANAPLGRQDLMTLVDPQAIEMDQDYNCPHDSNPLCSYTTYGPACLPETAEIGTQLYTDTYGSYGASYSPQACP
ncbi:MAG TPA: hypothetical protein VGH28_23120 [Polyangiaceae bacterium]